MRGTHVSVAALAILFVLLLVPAAGRAQRETSWTRAMVAALQEYDTDLTAAYQASSWREYTRRLADCAGALARVDDDFQHVRAGARPRDQDSMAYIQAQLVYSGNALSAAIHHAVHGGEARDPQSLWDARRFERRAATALDGYVNRTASCGDLSLIGEGPASRVYRWPYAQETFPPLTLPSSDVAATPTLDGRLRPCARLLPHPCWSSSVPQRLGTSPPHRGATHSVSGVLRWA